ncbi:hypothetical protein Phum_PHUM085030 [Pediculus humanus corporis]|uniref:Uncharacterized protein n=1 Tax=Pediculus humanus subsp. corporis TaxID=121224 RepID=E0VCA8_PEDHC|nr:uncharacterized protein Phum_PHUM085030 [Pediculus humanus corporis]EEB11030.1 hypothetical protein Phum_PHUM085030 [Pediculus humanus corporis]
MEEIYPEPHTLDQCDCTSYSYFGLSVMLLSVGSYISVLALGNIDGYLFSNLGHMWLVGPIFICSGLMIAVKSILYLRRKTLSKMLSRQRALLRGFQHLTQRPDQLQIESRNDSCQTLPPAYEALIDCQTCSNKIRDPSLPSYEEAMYLSRGKLSKSDEFFKIPSAR